MAANRKLPVEEELRQANESLVQTALAEQKAVDREKALREELQARNDALRVQCEELRASEERFRYLAQYAGDGVICADSRANIVFWNHAAERMFGHTFAEMASKPLTSLMPERFREAHLRGLTRTSVTGHSALIGKTIEVVGLRKDGTEFPAEVSIGTFETTEGVFFTGIVRDTAKRKHEEELLQQAIAYAESIVETVREPLLVLSSDLRVRTANRSFYQTFQVSPDQTEGRLVYELSNGDWDIPRLRQLLGDILPGNTHFGGFEVEHDFSRIGQRTMLLNARRITRGGGTNGHLILLAIEDISEHKRAEQFREQYSALIAHDLRSPLTVIIGMADLLRRSLAGHHMEREANTAERIGSAGRRMEEMIKDLIAVARFEGGHVILHREPTNLPPLVDDIRSRVGTDEDARRIEVKASDHVPLALVDQGQLERVIVNLVTNALKYSPEDKPVVVEIGLRGAAAVVSVIDQGAGIPEVERAHLFDRFYRTSTSGQHEGLGLGLYIARLIVEAHGGEVSVESKVGQGSSFRFTVPLA